MTFPDTQLDVTAELELDGTWTDVTSYVLVRDGITIQRGRRGESQSSDYGSCRFTLNNSDGRFSARNPSGPYYGQLTRNVPFRLSIPAATSHLYINGLGYASTPDDASLSVTDLDVRVDVKISDLGLDTEFASKYTRTSDERSWAFGIQEGILYYSWSTDGTYANSVEVDATEMIPPPIFERRAFRVTHDVDNGSSQNVVTFYTSDTIDGSWTQLGDAVTTAGTTFIYDSTATLYVGGNPDGALLTDGDPHNCRFYAFVMLDSIGGTAVADADFTAQSDRATSFTGDAGLTWDVGGTGLLTKRDYRFHGEVSDWPLAWDKSERSVYSSVTAAGPLRRLTHGAAVTSAYRRGCTVGIVEGLRAYWPCEDADGSVTIASAYPNGHAAGIDGTVTLASDSESFVCSDPLPVMGAGSVTGVVRDYTDTGEIQVLGLFAFPSGGTTNGAVILRVTTTGTAARFDVTYGTGGNIYLYSYDADGNLLSSDGPAAFGLDGKTLRLGLGLTNSGSDVDTAVSTLEVGADTGYNNPITFTSQQIGRAFSVTVSATHNLNNVTFGHVTMADTVPATVFSNDDQLRAYLAEGAGERFYRLVDEENYVALTIGDRRANKMGYQTPKALVATVREPEDTDGGIIFENRHSLGLTYRSARGLSNQNAAVTLDYTAKVITDIQPVDDDRYIENDITVSRSAGSSYRAVDETSALSTQLPPNGVGTYSSSATVSTMSDTLLPEIAYWRLHMGTVDEARYPTILVNLAHPEVAGDSSLVTALTEADIGDRLVISNPPDWLPPDDITQLIIGTTEYLGPYERSIEFVCQPESPFRMLAYETTDLRFSSVGTTVSVGIARYEVAFSGGECRSIAGDNPTDDLDVRVYVALDDWTPSSESVVAAKYVNSGNQRCWAFDINTSGYPHVYMSDDGATYTGVTATATTGFTDGTAHWIRFTLDADNGSSQYEVDFYGSDDGVTWTQIGTTITGGSVMNLYDSSADYQLGARSGTSVTSSISGTVYYVQILDGIAGTDLVTNDPGEWADGYSGSGTGTSATDQTSSVFAVTTIGETVWGHADGDFDIKVAGERITITDVSGTDYTQLFTGTRSVNGVTKAHAAGEDVALFDPTYWAF